MLSEEQLKQAVRLTNEAKDDRIAIFFGAGVSVPSGLPTWGGLLAALEQGLVEESVIQEWEAGDMRELNVLDRATLLQMRMGKEELKHRTAKITSKGLFTPAHALIGAMNVMAITTNYDSLCARSQPSRRLPPRLRAGILRAPRLSS